MTDMRCYCHVCGELHWIETSFLSASSGKEIDGIVYPIRAHGHHTPAEIRAAYERWTDLNSLARRARREVSQ